MLLLLFSTWLAALCGFAVAADGDKPDPVHIWPNVRGNVGSYGVSDVKVPRNFSGGRPTWKWTHPNGIYGTTVVGGPVIDYEKNLYIVEQTGLHKFSPDGNLLWTTRPEFTARPGGCFFPDGPSLMGWSVFVTTTCGELCSVDIRTGQYNWGRRCRQYYPTTGPDSKYVTGHDGVVIIGTDDAGGGGSKHVVGVNAADGNKLWDFTPDVPTWNNMGQFAGDDTVVFQDWDSRAYLLGLHNGTLLWKSGGKSTNRHPFPPYAETWTDGGLLLGADGVAYAVSSSQPQQGSAVAYGGGGVHAHRMSDGKLLWEAQVAHPVLTWPVSAKLEGDDSFTVFAFPSPGAKKNCMPWALVRQYVQGAIQAELPMVLLQSALTGVALAVSVWYFSSRKCSMLMLVVMCVAVSVVVGPAVLVHSRYDAGRKFWTEGPPQPSEIVALDAKTGATKWKKVLFYWDQPTAKGDDEGYEQKSATQPWRGLCCPVAYSSPSVDGNGVVYIGHMSGNIFGVKDWDKNGVISDDEVERFDAEGAFLHSGPAFAPGIFAFTTCDQLFVFRF